VDDGVALQQIDQSGVGIGVGQRSSEYEDVAAPDPDDVEGGQSVHRAGFSEVEQGYL
jgi:hypothetical protein